MWWHRDTWLCIPNSRFETLEYHIIHADAVRSSQTFPLTTDGKHEEACNEHHTLKRRDDMLCFYIPRQPLLYLSASSDEFPHSIIYRYSGLDGAPSRPSGLWKGIFVSCFMLPSSGMSGTRGETPTTGPVGSCIAVGRRPVIRLIRFDADCAAVFWNMELLRITTLHSRGLSQGVWVTEVATWASPLGFRI